jgi:hypothetical protein
MTSAKIRSANVRARKIEEREKSRSAKKSAKNRVARKIKERGSAKARTQKREI